MTQTLKKPEIEVISSDDYYNKLYKDPSKLRAKILNCLFRNITFVKNYEVKIKAISSLGYNFISNQTSIPVHLVHKYISQFLVDLIRIRKFLTQNPEMLQSNNQSKKVQIYLHKLHRLAPIFDYKRAKENARRLKIKLDRIFFWPQVMTQIAIIIFITDMLDKDKKQKIIQVNLQALCSCSVYAFHRTRNRVGLTPKYIKSL